AKALRIVALAPHIVENLYAIGAGDNIVGTVDYADYPAAAKSITRIGGYYGISIEKLLVLKPDIVIAWKSGNQSDDLAQIERLGIKLYLTDPTTVTGIADELLMLGKLTGNI
ncbi:helical backbone metal receptor, partial [Pseudoalteromonas sp. GW168-MNA-CIBAN-0100]